MGMWSRLIVYCHLEQVVGSCDARAGGEKAEGEEYEDTDSLPSGQTKFPDQEHG